MKQSMFWQNPHVDVFKYFNILDLKQNVDFKGKVSAIHEKELGSKKVLKIEGQNSSSSYVKFPSKTSKTQSLGLIGNYVYLQIIVPTGSIFTFNIWYKVQKKTYKIVYSNIFKKIKKQNDLTLNVPVLEHPSNWSILGIDSKNYLNHLLEITESSEYEIKAIELCPNMRVKNIYTSNNLYCLHSLPKDFNFTQNSKYKFEDKHQFIMLGDKTWQENKNDEKENEEEKNKPNSMGIKNKSINQKKYLKSILKDTNNQSFNAQEQVAANHKIQINKDNQQEQIDQPRIEPKPFILEEKPILQEKKQDFSIQPTPIMQLSHVQGYTGGQRNLIKFGKGSIVYSTGNIMVMMDLKTRVQKYFFGQHSDINNIVGNFKNNIIVSTDQTQISIWDSETLQRTGFYYTGFAQIISMDICISEKSLYVILGALDNQRRPSLMLLQNDQILVKQISDFDISRVKFIDNQNIDSGFITIGKESIRYWKLKKTFDKDHVLNGHSVFLGEHARENQFTDVSIQSESKKALIVSNQGNLYIVDNLKREIVGVYKIHEEGCKTIQTYENSKTGDFIVTSDLTGRIKLWTSDFTNILLEVKIDSQVSCMVIYDEKLILCGCLNGTLGILEREKKLFNFLVRSHNDDVILLRYHNFARKLVSISSDYTIRIWEILGNEEVVFFSEVYEFRCLDDQVTTLQCFNKKEKILCGFESGNIRVFDIKNYQITFEVDFHQAPVTSIAINFNDQTGISADSQGTVVIFNEEMEQMKTKESDKMYDNPRVGFNFRGDLYYILNDPFNLKIYSLQSDAVKFWVSTQEKIMNVSFSQHQEDFFVITEKGKIKKYKLNENTGKIVLYRQYAAMHDGVISSITPSSNCTYLFTTGDDKLIKIWDYHFRGGISPAFQAYNCGEQLDFVDLTNDDLNLVISYGKKSRTLYCWKFKSSLFETDEENDNISEILEKEDEVQVDNIIQANVFSNLTKTIVQGNYTEEQKDSKPQDIKSIYQNEEQIMDYAQQQLNNQNQQNNNNNQQHFDQNNQQQQNYQQVQDNQDGQYNINNNNDIENENQENQELLPGQYIQKQYVIGYDNEVNFPQQKLIWNQDQNYYILTSGNYVIVNNISENRNQKIFQEQQKTCLLTVAPNMKYFAYAVRNSKGTIKIVDSKNLSLIKNINHNFVDQLQTIQISPCSNYIITVFTLNSEPNAFITIFEIATSKIISCSTLVKPDFMMLKWDHSEIGSLEFTVLTKTSVFFYRLSNRQNLEFIESPLEKQQISNFGLLLCCEYLELEDKNILLVGSQQGSLLIYDINTGSLLCICKQVISGPITTLQASQKKLIAYSNNVNVFNWDFKSQNNNLTFSKMARQLEQKPIIINLDSVPCFISEKQRDELDEQMVITRQGILWVVDFNDKVTLQINSSHVSQRSIQQVQYIVNDLNNYHNGFLFSSSSDYTMKLYKMGENEIKTEFYAPKKECLAFDVFKEIDIVCGGYQDGYLRFFDYHEHISLGTVALIEQQKNISYPITTVKVIPRTRNLIAGNTNGDIFMVYIRNPEKNKFKIDLNKLVDNVGFQVNQISISNMDPLELWLVCTQNGKIMVWNRKCLKRNVNPAEELSSIYEIEYYLTDNYRIYKNNAIQSERQPDKNYQNDFCRAEFSQDERDIIFAISKNQKEVILRNFREHMNIKTLPIKYNPMYIQLGYKNDSIIVADTEGGISIYDYNSGIELDRQQICTTGISSLQLMDIRHQLPNYEQINKNDPNQTHPPYLIASSQHQLFVFSVFI